MTVYRQTVVFVCLSFGPGIFDDVRTAFHDAEVTVIGRFMRACLGGAEPCRAVGLAFLPVLMAVMRTVPEIDIAVIAAGVVYVPALSVHVEFAVIQM